MTIPRLTNRGRVSAIHQRRHQKKCLDFGAGMVQLIACGRLPSPAEKRKARHLERAKARRMLKRVDDANLGYSLLGIVPANRPSLAPPVARPTAN